MYCLFKSVYDDLVTFTFMRRLYVNWITHLPVLFLTLKSFIGWQILSARIYFIQIVNGWYLAESQAEFRGRFP